jgi:hypothetical protein
VSVPDKNDTRLVDHREHGDDFACIWLRRLLCGIPSDARKRRLWLVLQLFADDSGRGEAADNPVFVLAGYIGRVQNWEGAVDDLQRIMQKKPILKYLKGTEAAALKGNFKGWTEKERDAKLAEMIRVLHKYRMSMFSIGVTYRDFNRILAQPKGVMKNPYMFTFANMVGLLLNSIVAKTPREKIELIFDQGTIGRERDIQAAWKGMVMGLPEELKGILIGRPRFEDDRCFLPLQMADLLAWHFRRNYYEILSSNRTRQLESNVWHALRTINGKELYLTPAVLLESKRRAEVERFTFDERSIQRIITRD